jgi:hypothetical protein
MTRTHETFRPRDPTAVSFRTQRDVGSTSTCTMHATQKPTHEMSSGTRPLVFVLALVLAAGTACRRGPRGSGPIGTSSRRDVEPIAAQSITTHAMPPVSARCPSRLVQAPDPGQWASFSRLAESEDTTAVTTWQADHYRGGTFESRLGPFAIRYDRDGRDQCSMSEIRQADCEGPPLKTAAGWPGGELRLRGRDDAFVISYFPGGNAEVLLFAFRREPRVE